MFGDIPSKSSSLSSYGFGTPQFPVFLLPSLTIPFRRKRAPPPEPRRESRARSFDSTSTFTAPSLSSSPGASTAASSPTSPSSLAFDFSALNSKLPATQTPARVGSHLARANPDTIRCRTCAVDIAFGAQIVSKGFTGRHGRAFLVSAPSAVSSPSCPASPVGAGTTAGLDLVNVRVGRSENRQLVTGAHIVADISCLVCGTKLGWKYVDAKEPAQKYKVGKFILETARVVSHRSWDDVDSGSPQSPFPAFEYETTSTHRKGARRSSAQDEVAGSEPRSSEDGVSEAGTPVDDSDDDVIVFDSEDEEECEDIFAGVWDAEVVARRRKGKVANMKKRL